MYILKNALVSITRNKGRNLLIGIIILVISCSAAVTLAINNSSNDLISSYQAKYETEATIGINRENMMKDFDPRNRDESKENMRDKFSSASNISVEDIEKYGKSKYVKSYYYVLNVGVNSDDLEATSISFDNDDKFGGKFGGFGQKMEESSDFTLKGYSSIESMNEFIEGKYTIVDGQVSEDFDSKDCLINKELATLNELEVGDKIEVVDPNNEDNTLTLNIIGIYEENDDSKSNGMSMFTDSANTIITNTNVIKELSDNDEDLKVSTNPTFVLISSDVIQKFENELKEKGLDENLKLETNLDQINGATSTISNVKTFAVTFLIITLIIGVIVLLVINMINIRERKYEIGVLRTIGMKKSKVTLQFVSELLIVSVVFLIMGASIGAIISVPVSNSLLKSEISNSEDERNNISDNFGFKDQGPGGKEFQNRPNKNFKGVVQMQAYDKINAVVDFKVLMELFVIGLMITFISSISAMVSIQKFSPLTILKERS